MQVKVKKRKIDENKTKLEVIVPAAEMEEEIKGACRAIAYQRRITPEKDRTPKEVVFEKLGEKDAQDLLDKLIMDAASHYAIADKKLEVVGQPSFYARNKAEEDKDFEFSLTAVTKPHYGLGVYDPVEVSVPRLQVRDEDIEMRIQEIAAAHPMQKTDSSHTDVREGDELEIKLETTKDGKPVEGLTFDMRPYKAGAQLMPDDFDAALIGMKVGETKTFSFEGPSFELAEDGKPAMETYECTLTVLRLINMVSPEITSAWVEVNMPECETLDGLKAKIRGDLEEERARQQEQYVSYMCVDELAKRITDPIPDPVYEANYAEIVQSFEYELLQQNMTREEFLQRQGMDEQGFGMQLMMENRSQLKQRFALDALADHLRLSVTAEDLDKFFGVAAPGNEEQARRNYETTGRMYIAKEAALRMKANDWLIDNSTINYIEIEEALAAQEAAAERVTEVAAEE